MERFVSKVIKHAERPDKKTVIAFGNARSNVSKKGSIKPPQRRTAERFAKRAVCVSTWEYRTSKNHVEYVPLRSQHVMCIPFFLTPTCVQV